MVEFVLRLQEAKEFLSAALIGPGVLLASCLLVRLLLTSRQKTAREMRQAYQGVRLKLSRHLAMALEFQLAADLPGTTVTPSWEEERVAQGEAR